MDRGSRGTPGAVDIFEGLSTSVLLHVAMLGEEQTFDSGAAIVRQGETGAALFIVLAGDAIVTVDGQERARIGAGDYSTPARPSRLRVTRAVASTPHRGRGTS